MLVCTEGNVYFQVNDNTEIKRHWSHATPFAVSDDTPVKGKQVFIEEEEVATILIATFAEELAQLFPDLEISKDAFDWDIGSVWIC
jgi:hypothetical protein